MEKGWNKFKQAWNDNPLLVIGVCGFTLAAAGKFMDATTNARRVRTWEKEVDRRDRMSR